MLKKNRRKFCGGFLLYDFVTDAPTAIYTVECNNLLLKQFLNVLFVYNNIEGPFLTRRANILNSILQTKAKSSLNLNCIFLPPAALRQRKVVWKPVKRYKGRAQIIIMK